MKLTIYRKLLLSYLVMALLTVLASVYAIFSLQQLNDLAYRIINDDVTVVDVSKKLMDALIAQESAEKRYLILRDISLEEIFLMRGREFKKGLSGLRNSRLPGNDAVLATTSNLHSQYDEIFAQEVNLIRGNRFEEAQKVSEDQGRKAIDEIAFHIRGMQKQAEKDIDLKMNEIKTQGLHASRVTVLLALVSLAVAFLVVMIVTYNI